MFSGFTPKLVTLHNDLSATTTIPVCKFDTIHTVVDWFWIAQTALSTNNSTTHARMRVYDGATTGNGTATAVTRSGTWTAFTGVTNGTNYTYAANDWMLNRYCETGTVAIGTWMFQANAVQGNV